MYTHTYIKQKYHSFPDFSLFFLRLYSSFIYFFLNNQGVGVQSQYPPPPPHPLVPYGSANGSLDFPSWILLIR